MALVSVPLVRESDGQQELSFRLAEPDFKDWLLLCLAVASFIGVLALLYGSIFIGGNPFNWFQNLTFFLVPIQFLLRLDRFVNARWTFDVAGGVASLKIKGVIKKSLVVQDSVISGGSLFSVEDPTREKPLSLPDDWVGSQPAKLLAALSVIRQGARLDDLARETLKQPENPKVIWVEDAGFFETDGIILVVFGMLFTLIGIAAMARSTSHWWLLAFGVLLIAVGLYVTARNWRPEERLGTLGYRIEGSTLTGKADGHPNAALDLACDKLTIQYWNGLTRHSLRIGWVDQKGTFRALSHWQEKITEDLSRIVTVAAAHGNLPEVVRWSAPR